MSSTADVDMKLLTKYTFLSLALTSIALAIITSEQLQNPIDYSESKSYIRSMLTYFGFPDGSDYISTMMYLNLDRVSWKYMLSKDFIEAVIYSIFGSSIYILVFANQALNILCICFAFIIWTSLGSLRETERQKLRERLLNYLLFKLVFIGAVLEPDIYELLVWAAWFTALGFLQLCCFTTRDRLEWYAAIPGTALRSHMSAIALLVFILVMNFLWSIFCIYAFYDAGWSVLLLLLYECFALLLDTLQTLGKAMIHVYDMRSVDIWESKNALAYYVEFVTDTLNLTFKLLHFLHIWALNGISFTLIDAVLFLNMRVTFNKLRKKLCLHQNYRKVLAMLDSRFPDASEEDIHNLNDTCAICQMNMESAKKLPCGHMFHRNCLRQWFQRIEVHTCPICRLSLLQPPTSSNTNDGNDATETVNTSNQTEELDNTSVGETPPPTTSTEESTANVNEHDANTNANTPPTLNENRNTYTFSSNDLPTWFPIPSFSFEFGTVTHNASQGIQMNTAAQSDPQTEDAIRRILEVLPDVTSDAIRRHLMLADGDVNTAILNMLQDPALPRRPLTPESATESPANTPSETTVDATSVSNKERLTIAEEAFAAAQRLVVESAGELEGVHALSTSRSPRGRTTRRDEGKERPRRQRSRGKNIHEKFELQKRTLLFEARRKYAKKKEKELEKLRSTVRNEALTADPPMTSLPAERTSEESSATTYGEDETPEIRRARALAAIQRRWAVEENT